MKKYIFVAFVVVLSVTCFASYSFGIDKAKKLLALGHCPNCDLSGADLKGVELNGANLVSADLRGANLSEADLSEADLRYANLRGADLTGAKMKNAKINGYTIFCNTKTPWGLDNSGCK